jgi:hypothetical protein
MPLRTQTASARDYPDASSGLGQKYGSLAGQLNDAICPFHQTVNRVMMRTSIIAFAELGISSCTADSRLLAKDRWIQSETIGRNASVDIRSIVKRWGVLKHADSVLTIFGLLFTALTSAISHSTRKLRLPSDHEIRFVFRCFQYSLVVYCIIRLYMWIGVNAYISITRPAAIYPR